MFVTGSSAGVGTNDDYATLAYSAATGALLWAKRHGSAGNVVNQASALTVTPDALYVYGTGFADGGGNLTDYATVAYGTVQGGLVGMRQYDGSGNDDHASAIATNGRLVFVTGASDWGTVFDDYITVAYAI